MGCSLNFILVFVSGARTLPSSFRLDLFRSFSIEGCRSLHLFFVFFSFRLPGLLLLPLLSFAILQYSSVGFFVISFLSWGLSPSPCSSQCMVPLGFLLPVLVPALSFVLFFVSLVLPFRIACFGLGPFLRLLVTGSSLLVPLLLSFSPLGGFYPFLRDFLRFLIPSLLRVVLFSSRFCRSFGPPLRLP